MITTTFTQADLGGAPKTVLPSLADGGVYAVVFGGFVTSAAGANGFAYLRLGWTDAEGQAQQAQTTFFCDASIQQPSMLSVVTTLAHPSNLTLQIVNGSGATGLYTIDAHTYVTRAHEEG